jgi:hypothetical protein
MSEASQMGFDLWLEVGIRRGFISPPVCQTHDGTPVSLGEEMEWEDGGDPCIYVMRLYDSIATKREIELHSTVAQWRNPYPESEYPLWL